MPRPEKLVAAVTEVVSLLDKMSKQPSRTDTLSTFYQGLQTAAATTMEVDDTPAASPAMASLCAGGSLGVLVLALRGQGHESQTAQMLQLVLRLLQQLVPATSVSTEAASEAPAGGVGAAVLRGPDGSQLTARPCPLDKRLAVQLGSIDEGLLEEWLQAKLIACASAASRSAPRAPPSTPTPSAPLSSTEAENADDAFAVWQLVVQLLHQLLGSADTDAEHVSAKKALGDRLWIQLRRMLWPSVVTWRGETTSLLFALLEWMAVEQGRLADLVTISLELLNEISSLEDKLDAAAPTTLTLGSVAHAHSTKSASAAVCTLLDFLQRAVDGCASQGASVPTLNLSDRRFGVARAGADTFRAEDAGTAVDCEMEEAEVG